MVWQAIIPIAIQAGRQISSGFNFGGNTNNMMNLLTGLNFGGNKNESETQYDPLASIYEKGLESNFWRNDTQWYNDKIVSSAYQRARDSLENAGYNPLMALNNGGLYDQAPVMTGSATKASAKDISGNMSINKLANAQEANIWADTGKKNAETKLTSAQQTTEKYKQDVYAIQKRIAEIDEKLRKGELNFQQKRQALEEKKILSETQLNLTKAYAEGKNTDANVEYMGELTKNEIAQGDKAQRYYKWGKKHPILRNLDETVNRYINLNFGGNAGTSTVVQKLAK